MDGIVVSYGGMTPTPAISYDQTNNASAFNNLVQTTAGIASAERILEFKSPSLFKQSVQVGFNANVSDFFPMPLPSAPMILNIPAINSIGTVQATDLMIAKDGVMKLYSDIYGTHIYGDIAVDGNITNSSLQVKLDLKTKQSTTCTKTELELDSLLSKSINNIY